MLYSFTIFYSLDYLIYQFTVDHILHPFLLHAYFFIIFIIPLLFYIYDFIYSHLIIII